MLHRVTPWKANLRDSYDYFSTKLMLESLQLIEHGQATEYEILYFDGAGHSKESLDTYVNDTNISHLVIDERFSFFGLSR